VSAVAVRNAGHIGRLGAYTLGGAERRLGNNPVSIGVPGSAVLDIALSVAAEGRIDHLHECGETLPDGWILDPMGLPAAIRPTTLPVDRFCPSAARRERTRAMA
jgi:LDH2 family malate/lactate/ureidoglycolate dehydrogenase